MNENRDGVKEDLHHLEEEMRKRYGEHDPCVLKPPESVYRSYEAPPFWKKFKKVFICGGIVLSVYFLFFPMSQTLPLNGKVVAREMRVLDAALGGEIISVRKSIGDTVEKGETIARILNPALHEEPKRLQAETEVLETELAGLGEALRSGEKTLQTYKRLFEEGDLARLKLEEETAKVEAVASRFAVKDAEIHERKIRLSNLEARLEAEDVRSPWRGIITSPIQEKLNARVKEGETLCDVAYGGLRFEFKVKEEAVRSIKQGDRVMVKLDAYSGKRFEGVVDEIRPIVYEESPKPWLKAYQASVLVSAKKALPKEVRIGMSARSRIHLKQRSVRIWKWFRDWF